MVLSRCRVRAFRAALSAAILWFGPPLAAHAQEPSTVQPALDALVRALQGKQFDSLAPYLDESFRAGELPAPVARQMLERVVNGGFRVPSAVRVKSTTPEGSNVRVAATFEFPDGSRDIGLLVTSAGKFVEIPLFQVRMVGGAGSMGPGVRMSTGAPPAAGTAPAPEQPVADPELRAELLEMMRRDQEARPSLPPGTQVSAADRARRAAADSANMRRLEEIIARHGWPGAALVGSQASIGAFLVLQHADAATQERHLPLLRRAAERGDLPRSQLAMLEDRVLMHHGRKQLYGTQLWIDPATGQRVLWPVEDEAGVDTRRAAAGLPSLAMYLRGFGIEYTPPR
jgi:hypothetical protein